MMMDKEKQQDTSSNLETSRLIFTKKNLLFILALAGIAAVLYFFLWQRHSRPLIEASAKDADIAPVKVTNVEKRTLFREDQLPGEINAYQDVLIYPKIPGYIKWIGVDRGSVVKKGQLMVKMYAPEYMARRSEGMARVAEARADLASEESDLADLKADLKKRKAKLLADQSTYQRVYAASLVPGVIADNDVVQWSQTVQRNQQEVDTFIQKVNAKAHEVEVKAEQVDVMVKDFESFADFASYLEIPAPFNGYITERKMHVGSFVGPDGTGAYPPICRLQQIDLLRIVAPVPEVYTAGLIVGSEVEFSVSSFPGKRFTGKVARISNALDKDTRTMPVELNFLNPEFKILPGMFCKIYWPTRRRQDTMFVPITSVVSSPLSSFVCKVKNDEIEWVTVRKGAIMKDKVEVFGDLKVGDVVALHGSEELQNKMKIKPVKAENTSE